eukprot:TRINITY_DN2669_c0_g4_i1.p1 TRINITY_DN2669_c0_g4~~TRINITY_DN2669_c0_g4_i1.p1  ORF type:complete len:202 (+),score=65.55 TRINITY_DN2669_c0_g4_i1:49-654(+)
MSDWEDAGEWDDADAGNDFDWEEEIDDMNEVDEASDEDEDQTTVHHEEDRKLMEQQGDVEATADLFGDLGDNQDADDAKNLNMFIPQTAKDFEHYAAALGEKIASFGRNPNYLTFVNSILSKICEPLNTDRLASVTAHVSSIKTRKIQERKDKMGKKKKKTKKLNYVKRESTSDVFDMSNLDTVVRSGDMNLNPDVDDDLF